jgi:hypothetical protein
MLGVGTWQRRAVGNTIGQASNRLISSPRLRISAVLNLFREVTVFSNHCVKMALE